MFGVIWTLPIRKNCLIRAKSILLYPNCDPIKKNLNILICHGPGGIAWSSNWPFAPSCLSLLKYAYCKSFSGSFLMGSQLAYSSIDSAQIRLFLVIRSVQDITNNLPPVKSYYRRRVTRTCVISFSNIKCDVLIILWFFFYILFFTFFWKLLVCYYSISEVLCDTEIDIIGEKVLKIN